MAKAPLTTDPVALVTGGSGFLGREIVRGLLREGYQVILLLREGRRWGRRPDQVVGVVPVERRRRDLLRDLQAGPDMASRLHVVEADLSDPDCPAIAAGIRERMIGQIGSRVIDTVVHCGARLTMDYAGQDPEKRLDICRRNAATNVGGMAGLLQVLDLLDEGAPAALPAVRIIRPSIVTGPRSGDAYMAFIRFLKKKYVGTNLISIVRHAMRLLPEHVVLPLPGHPDSIIDMIDESEVTRAVLAMIRHDLQNGQPRPDRGPAITVRHFHQISTAYVHGRMTGLLAEAALPPAEQVRPKNSYEATKGQAEELLLAWQADRLAASMAARGIAREEREDLGRRVLQTSLAFNHITNPSSRTLAEVVDETLRAMRWDDRLLRHVQVMARGPAYDTALAELKKWSPVVHRILLGMWRELPMLEVYFFRDPGTRFDPRETRALLAAAGLDYRPAPLTARYVRDHLIAGLPHDNYPEDRAWSSSHPAGSPPA